MNNIDWSGTEFMFALKNKDKELIEFLEYKPGTSNCEECWMVCSSETLYLKSAWRLIEKHKPVYTKEMADNGELPSVGMECMIDDCKGNEFFERFDGKVLTIVSHDKNYRNLDVAVFKYDDGNGEFEYHALLARKFKPLTPPIELIDGKAYQFNARGKTLNGIYCKHHKTLNLEQGRYFDSVICTSIVLLTPEGES